MKLSLLNQGPPSRQPNAFPAACENGWVCEHRWSMIGNMAMFRASVYGTNVQKWTNGSNNQIAFSRGNKVRISYLSQDQLFLAINSIIILTKKINFILNR